MWKKQQQHYRSKVAIDISHYRLLERIVSSKRTAIILEDDAKLTGQQWLPELLTALQELPQVKTLLYDPIADISTLLFAHTAHLPLQPCWPQSTQL